MPAGVSAWTPLANTTVSGSTTTITFSSISNSYRDLVIVYSSPSQGSQVRPLIRFNSDSGSNYNEIRMVGNGSSTSSAAFSGSHFDATGFFSSYNDPFTILANVLDYSATDKHKSVLFRADGASQATVGEMGRWANTAAITTVSFVSANGSSFPTGLTIALYGVSA